MARGEIRYDGFPRGVDNRHANFALPTGALRDGVNIDVLSGGRIQRRRGISQAITDTGAHSLFADRAQTRMVWATKNTLKLSIDGVNKTTLLTDSRLERPLSWLELNGELYFSNEWINGKVNGLNQFERWGIVPPTKPPVVPNGWVTPPAVERRVQVTCTFVIARADDPAQPGEESGAPLGVVVTCGDTPTLNVSSIPQSSDSRVKWTRLYVTDLDGTVYFAAADVPAGTTSFLLRGPFGSGQELRTLAMQPPPVGQLLTEHGGRIYIAFENLLFRTQPLRLGCCDLEEDFHVEPARITLLAGVPDGLFLSSDRTYFLANPGDSQPGRTPVLPYCAIEGALCKSPDAEIWHWLSEDGLIRGAGGGAVKNLTGDQVAMTRYARACMGLTQYNGHKAIVSITQGGVPSALVHKDYLAAEITRLAEVE